MGKHMLLATCLHDARGYSYHDIIDTLKPKLVIYMNALRHNLKKARHVLAAWGDATIAIPRKEVLDKAVAYLRLPDWMKHVRWWIDSTDIRLPLTKQYKSHKGSY